MKVSGIHHRSIRLGADGWSVDIIDQTRLPHSFVIRTLHRVEDAAEAIREMRVRGAPLIGATAAYGVALAMHSAPDDRSLDLACELLAATRPTAINLLWALERMRKALLREMAEKRAETAYGLAAAICDEDVEINRRIGEHGLAVIRDAHRHRGGSEPVHILTHCNAGWLATVDWGTALAPIYMAHDSGLPVHVWVDETRPRNQGASLTAWELSGHGIPYDVIVDNAGGHLMQHGLVDLCITGTDRTTRTGDVCNKIGTYLKALAAYDNQVPFYVALPSPTIDWHATHGLQMVPIEERDALEVTAVTGINSLDELETVRITPAGATARNFAFDITPARLLAGLITERGICSASEAGLLSLFPERGEGAP